MELHGRLERGRKVGWWLLETFLVAASYALTAKLSFAMAVPPGNVSVVWPPSGIALAVILILGERMWLGVWLGSFVANTWFFTGITDPLAPYTLVTTAIIATGSTFQALLGALLIRNFVGSKDLFDRAQNVFAIVVIEVYSCFVAPLFGVTALCVAGFARWTAYGNLWWTWWLGDCAGVVLIAPFFLAWQHVPRIRFHLRRALEGVALALLTALASQVVFGWPLRLPFGYVPSPFLLVPFVIWSALRFGPRGVTLSLVALSAVAVAGTQHGHGPFATPEPDDGFRMLQTFLGFLSVPALILSATIDRYKRSEREFRRSRSHLETLIQETTGNLDIANKALRAESVGRKRTEEKYRESEQRFRLILAGVKDHAIFMLDPRGIVLTWGEGAKCLHGYEAEEIIGRDFSVLYSEDDLRWGKPRIELEVARTQGRLEEEAWRVRKDGSRYWASLVVTALRDSNGELRGFAAITRDVTARRKADLELRSVAQELELRVTELNMVNKELEAFSYSVSHDLRTPLRHIDGFVELLRTELAGSLNREGERYLGVISESARHMGTMIENLLLFSRMSRVELQKAPVDPNLLVKETIAALEMETKGREIEWKIGDLPRLEADAALMALVFTNLISNSLKYTRPRPTAVIEIGYAPHDGHGPAYFVRDNGVGFDMQYADKLFGVFQRLHTAQQFEGTGIGLANVRRIVHRHGGATWAEGAVDKGATFYFSVPSPVGRMKGPQAHPDRDERVSIIS
ncbi:MAG TPA: MASE1 domain-containing protein [Bacteroidota bacterium]